MSETTSTFDGMIDCVLDRYTETMRKGGIEYATLSREDLIGIYNAAAALTVAQEIEYAVLKITGQ